MGGLAMKKIIVLSLLALCLFCECNREYEAPKSFNGKTITATLAETKARLGEKSGNAYPNYWSAGDAISVNGVASDPLDASFDGQSQAEFNISSAVAPFKAVYPASVVMSFTGGAAGLTLPAVQNYTAGSYDPSAYVMIAQSATDSPLAFEPVMSLFKVVPSGSANIASVEISSLGENKLSGSFTTDFAGLQAAEGASGSVKINMPEGGVAPGTPIIICIPAGDYTAGISVKITDIGGGQMYRTAKPSKQYAAGTMYGAEISYVEDVLTAQVSAATSSSLIFSWDGPTSHAFTAALYSDAGCTQSVASFDIPAGDACWGEAAPKFVIGGLSPGTDYWFKATDTTSGLSSNVVKGTTNAFTHVQMPTTISETGTVLAEDFGEIRWHSDMINAAAGFIPTNIGSFSNSGVREYVAGNTNSGEIPFTENTAPLQSSRLKNWAVDSRAFYHCGHLNLGNNLGNGWILTPEFTVPSGKKATVKLTITAARYNESQETEWAVVVLDQSGANVTGNTASFTWPDSYKTVALSKNREWETVSVNGLELRAGDRIAFGPKKGTARNKGRVFINDLKAEVLQLTDIQDTPIVANTLEITSSTLAFTWNEKGEEAADANLKYVATLYSDAACSTAVRSYTFAAGQGSTLWRNKYPRFIFSGLGANTQYYFRVTDGSGQVSNVVAAKTSAFTTKAMPTSITGNGLAFAEDFSILVWDFDYGQGCAGMQAPASPTAFNSFGTSPMAFSESTGNYPMFTSSAFATSSLKNWSRKSGTDALVTVHPGHVTIGSNAVSQRAWILTPTFTVASGKVATVTVSITVRKGLVSAVGDYAVGVLNNTEINWPTTITGEIYQDFSVNNEIDWQKITFTGLKIKANDRIVVGARKDFNYDSKVCCLSLSDISVTVTAVANTQ